MVNIYPGFIGESSSSNQLSPDQILLLLGYTDYQAHDTYIERRAAKTLNSVQFDRVTEILGQLKAIDNAITGALTDSAVGKTCNTEMNWPAHLKMLREQGHSLLQELGRLYDLPVGQSKYATKTTKAYVQYQ